jgi:stage V sporulation protein B
MIEDHSKNLVKGSFYLLLNNLSNMTLGMLFWILMAKLLEPSLLGQVMIVIAFANTIIGFTGNGVSVMLSKYIAEFNAKGLHNNAKRVFILGLRLALFMSVIAAIIIALLSNNIANNIYHNVGLAQLLLFTAITFIPSQTITSLLNGAFEGSQRMRYTLFTTLIFQISRISLAIILILYGLSNLGVIISFIISSILAALIGYLYIIPKILPKSNGRHDELNYTLKFSGLNYINAGIGTLSTQIGVMILGVQNIELAAFYGIASIISQLIGGITGSLARALLPTLSQAYARDNKQSISNTINISLKIGLSLTGFIFIILILEPNYILNLLSKEYIETANALMILVLASLLSSFTLLFNSILNAYNMTEKIVKIGLFSYSLTIILTIILTPLISLKGAALSILIGSLSMSILSALSIKKLEIGISNNIILKGIVSIVSALIIGYIINTSIQEPIITLLISILSYASFLFIYKSISIKEIYSLLSIINNKV